MATTAKQLAANKKNSNESTGPRTAAGKEKASRNALRHGLLSSRLFLEGENPDEFEELTLDLHSTLRPVGAIEHALMERIALNLWRQRRLIEAETAMLNLERRDQKIAAFVSEELERGYSSKLNESELVPFDKEQAEWCQAVIDEFESAVDLGLDALEKAAPLIYNQLLDDAKEDGETIEEYLADWENGVSDYVEEQVRWCRQQITEAEQRPVILAVANKARSKRVVLPQRYLDLFARYQTTLDNQLYKAIRAFREAQEWRLKTLEAEPVEPVGDLLEPASA